MTNPISMNSILPDSASLNFSVAISQLIVESGSKALGERWSRGLTSWVQHAFDDWANVRGFSQDDEFKPVVRDKRDILAL